MEGAPGPPCLQTAFVFKRHDEGLDLKLWMELRPQALRCRLLTGRIALLVWLRVMLGRSAANAPTEQYLGQHSCSYDAQMRKAASQLRPESWEGVQLVSAPSHWPKCSLRRQASVDRGSCPGTSSSQAPS